jgi:hypothetical protein
MKIAKKKKAKTKVKVTHIMAFLVAIFVLYIFMVLQTQVGPLTASGKRTEAPLMKMRQAKQTGAELRSYAKNGGLVVDIMSIGSNTRIRYQQTQRETFGSHKSVRFFFNITELDDSDPNCAHNFTPVDSHKVSKFCRTRKWEPHQLLMSFLRNPYASKLWLKHKSAPHGWMCAQVRPSHGLAKVVAKYREMKKTHGEKALPDYLVIADDDTYVNMELFEKYMSTFDTSIPRAVAGCMVRSPIREVNFTSPFGGFGMVFSKGTLFSQVVVYVLTIADLLCICMQHVSDAVPMILQER